jgi:membrane peptidoglycan carboxypeptidase
LWATLAILSTLAVLGLGAYAGWNLRDLPRPGDTVAILHSVDVYDRTGQLLAQRSPDGEFHIYTALSQMGKYGPAATLAAEDRGFYQHPAVDATSVVRASAADLLSGGVVEGGSTITQQLVKLELLGPEQTFSRKLEEAFLAYAMERRYSKDEILEMYLNRVYYGHGAYGLASAVKAYFGGSRTPAQLTAAQAAFLAGLLQAPNALDPQTNWNGARARELYVLAGMRQTGALTAAQEQQAEQEDVHAELKYDTSYRAARAPQFVEMVMQDAERDIGATALQQGVRIYTTLDPTLQSLAEQSVSAGVKDLGRLGVNNGALMAARPATGEILAYVGSADYGNDAIGGQFDVVRAFQQPGSTFKPYVFEAALRDHVITLCTTLEDRRTDFGGGYVPNDYDDRFLGPLTARRALVLSRNVPAVEVGQLEGMDRVDALAKSMGITSTLAPNPSGAIGTDAVSIYDQVQGYSVFAEQGRKVPLMDITRIDDEAGDPLFQQRPGAQSGQQIVTPAEAYLLTDVLQDYQRQWGLGWNRQMAAKSGTTGSTTNEHPQAWMMAYNPDIVVGAWGGNTGPDGKSAPVAAFGTDVGKTIEGRFINGLPADYRQWYTRPSGLVTGRGGELFLPGTQNNCSTPSSQTGDNKKKRS